MLNETKFESLFINSHIIVSPEFKQQFFKEALEYILDREESIFDLYSIVIRYDNIWTSRNYASNLRYQILRVIINKFKWVLEGTLFKEFLITYLFTKPNLSDISRGLIVGYITIEKDYLELYFKITKSNEELFKFIVKQAEGEFNFYLKKKLECEDTLDTEYLDLLTQFIKEARRMGF